MMLDIFIFVALCCIPASCIHCEEDVDLNDVQEYSAQIDNISDLDYWRTAQNNFQVFGKFEGDPSSSIIKAGYYTKDNQLIYGLTVDCGKKKWSSQVTENDTETDTVKGWLQGDLATICESGAIFDIWFKVHQPLMMSWIYNGQPLQFETRTSYFRRGHYTPVKRTRPLKVYTKYGSNRGKYFKIKASGMAKFTRLSWGQCITWPLSMQGNCQQARLWVLSRSKMSTAVTPLPGLGQFGADSPTFAPACFQGSKYYHYIQRLVHPDRNSGGYPYCCCVDMVTGLTGDNDKNACNLPTVANGCPRTCEGHYARKDLIDEVMAEKEPMDESLIL